MVTGRWKEMTHIWELAPASDDSFLLWPERTCGLRGCNTAVNTAVSNTKFIRSESASRISYRLEIFILCSFLKSSHMCAFSLWLFTGIIIPWARGNSSLHLLKFTSAKSFNLVEMPWKKCVKMKSFPGFRCRTPRFETQLCRLLDEKCFQPSWYTVYALHPSLNAHECY